MWIQKVSGGGIDGLVYSSNGATLYTIDGLGRFAAWDMATRETRPLMRLDPDDRGDIFRLLVSSSDRFLVAVRTGNTVACNVATGHQHARAWVSWPKEARLMPGGGARLAMPAEDWKSFACWDIGFDSREELKLSGWVPGERVRSFDFAPDGRTVAVMGETGEVALADSASGEVLTRITVPRRAQWLAHVQFAPNGNTLLLFTHHQLVLWDIPRGAVRAETLKAVPFEGTFAVNPTLPVFAALNPDRVLTLYNLDTGKPLRSLDFGLGRFVQCVAFSPDGLTCAVGGSNKQFAVFDVDL